MSVAWVVRILFVLILATSPELFANEYAVIVNKETALDSLTISEVRNIYLSNTESFPDGTEVMPLDHLKGTEERKEFYKEVIQLSDQQFKTYFSSLIFTGKGRPPYSLPSSKAIIEQVRLNKSVIGYVHVSMLDGSVKVVCRFKSNRAISYFNSDPKSKDDVYN